MNLDTLRSLPSFCSAPLAADPRLAADKIVGGRSNLRPDSPGWGERGGGKDGDSTTVENAVGPN